MLKKIGTLCLQKKFFMTSTYDRTPTVRTVGVKNLSRVGKGTSDVYLAFVLAKISLIKLLG